jgi:hypothetical protein
MMAAATALALAAGAAQAGDTPISKKAYLYIGWPNDGEVIRSTKFRVWFGLRNVRQEPPALRRGTDPDGGRAAARPPYAAAGVRGPRPRAAQPAGGVQADHDHGRALVWWI